MKGQRMFFVDPSGDDSGPGTAERPFGTLERAREAAGPGDTVVLRGGVHRLDRTLLLTEADSGVTYRAHGYGTPEQEEVVISGGRPVTGWRAGPGGTLLADSPARTCAGSASAGAPRSAPPSPSREASPGPGPDTSSTTRRSRSGATAWSSSTAGSTRGRRRAARWRGSAGTAGRPPSRWRSPPSSAPRGCTARSATGTARASRSTTAPTPPPPRRTAPRS
ncbi:hypothetical protein ACFQXA_08480 [Nocardiopsis composta]